MQTEPRSVFLTVTNHQFDGAANSSSLLCSVRREYFKTHIGVSGRANTTESGVEIRIRYRIGRHGMDWEKKAGDRTLQRAYSIKGGYELCTWNMGGEPVSKTRFNLEHVWIQTAYYYPAARKEGESLHPVELLRPDSADGLLRLSRDSATGQYKQTRLAPCVIFPGTAEQAVENDRFGDAVICAETLDGSFCFCPSKEVKQREAFRQNGGEVFPVRIDAACAQEEDTELDFWYVANDDAMDAPIFLQADRKERQETTKVQPESVIMVDSRLTVTEPLVTETVSKPEESKKSAEPKETTGLTVALEPLAAEEPEISMQPAEQKQEPPPSVVLEPEEIPEPISAEEEDISTKLEPASEPQTAFGPETAPEQATLPQLGESAKYPLITADAEVISLPLPEQETENIQPEDPQEQAEQIEPEESLQDTLGLESVLTPDYPSDRDLFYVDTGHKPSKYTVASRNRNGILTHAPELSAEQAEELSRAENSAEALPGTEAVCVLGETSPSEKVTVSSVDDLERLAKKTRHQIFDELDKLGEKAPDKWIQVNEHEKYAYYGGLEDGLREGTGRTQMPNGRTAYEGGYHLDKRDGFGAYYYKSGRICYVGGWKENHRHGTGISFHPKSGRIFSGVWENDVPSGQGSLMDSTGNLLYAGEWKDGKRCGFGTEYRGEQAFYSGMWENDQWNGYGTLHLSCGTVVTGNFVNGSIEGMDFGFTSEEK